MVSCFKWKMGLHVTFHGVHNQNVQMPSRSQNVHAVHISVGLAGPIILHPRHPLDLT